MDVVYCMLCIYSRNDTPPSEAPEVGNNQPHLIVFNHDDFHQFFVSIEWKLFMECADLASALLEVTIS